MTTTTLKKLPGVLSLTRRVNATDALFFNMHADGSETPLLVKRVGLRGTQNVNKDKGDKRQEVSNVQVTDTAKSNSQAVAVVVKMGVNFYPIKDGVNSCALGKKDEESLLADFKQSYNDFIGRAEASDGLSEVSNRFARNIANGKWLWRNRQYSASIKVEVTCGDELMEFDALKVPLNSFGDYSNAEQKLGAFIASSLRGDSNSSLEVRAVLDFGKGMNSNVEVFPSQNYLGGSKPKGFARSLYAVDVSVAKGDPGNLIDLDASPVIGQAAIRDTKASNAFRTFDTWYSDYADHGLAIAVEPNGANLGAQKAFRVGAESSFAYARKLNQIDVNGPEGMFMIAALVRGGVYSEGEA